MLSNICNIDVALIDWNRSLGLMFVAIVKRFEIKFGNMNCGKYNSENKFCTDLNGKSLSSDRVETECWSDTLYYDTSFFGFRAYFTPPWSPVDRVPITVTFLESLTFCLFVGFDSLWFSLVWFNYSQLIYARHNCLDLPASY